MTVRDATWIGGEPALFLSGGGVLTSRWAGEPVVVHAWPHWIEELAATSYMTRSVAGVSKMARSLPAESGLAREFETEAEL